MPKTELEQIDFLVVGSGLAALVFGALASQSGARVKILEAHEHPGGYGHTFSMGQSAKFNAQFHYVWNCGKGETVHQVLEALGLEQEITFEQLDPKGFDRMIVPGHDIKIPASSTELIQRLTQVAPQAKSNIEKFVQRVNETSRGLDLIASKKTVSQIAKNGFAALTAARHANNSLQDVFDLYQLPIEVQAILASQWPDFLLPPKKLSFFAWVMLFTGYQRGAYYPSHHFESVIERLVQVIHENGGEVSLNQQITDFVIENDEVCGLIAKDLNTLEHYELRSHQVVSNMDPQAAAQMIGIERFTKKEQKKLRYEYSPSNFMIYCTVENLDLEALGFGKWNTFHSGDLDINQSFARMYEEHDYSNPSFAITTPGLMTDDVSDRPEGQEIIELLTVADYDHFDALLKQDRRAYLRKKKEIVESIFDVMEANYIPNFRDHIAFKISGSPTTNERFCLAPKGNSYGSNMTPHNISFGRVKTQTSLPGLAFCNASSGYPGFAGAFWNGRDLYRRLISSN